MPILTREEYERTRPPIRIERLVREGARERVIAEIERRRMAIPTPRESSIEPPTDSCCTHVCNILNDEIDGLLNKSYISKFDDKKLKVLRDFRFILFTKDSCQCADGEWTARKAGLPTMDMVREK